MDLDLIGIDEILEIKFCRFSMSPKTKVNSSSNSQCSLEKEIMTNSFARKFTARRRDNSCLQVHAKPTGIGTLYSEVVMRNIE